MFENSASHSSNVLRKKVAREAAVLLYSSQEKEYKQAKEKAALNLGIRILPTNLEVARELDIIAEENEGQLRKDRLLRMRKEAFEIMSTLKSFNPKLVGSVWRGTANINSDIDITVYSFDRNLILEKVEEKGFNIIKTEVISGPNQKGAKESFHITVLLSSEDKAEIVVRDPDEKNQKNRCEIYGDMIEGLDIDHLSKILKEDPLKRFIPKNFLS
ncbi:nucleotidyltransferase domain-containing protein [Candidatus Bathyarchaeota archaeon]|nr:nucleotidyltransferase domain-containing protein [Candidatus Bathyarchaeota archaeon]